MTVAMGNKVKFHFTGKFEDGKLFGTTKGRDPLECKIGEPRFIKGVEEALIGMKETEKKEIVIPPNKGYSTHDETLIKKMPKEILNGRDAKIGEVIRLNYEGDKTFIATVLDVDKDMVTLDLNDPLAGKTIIADIEIIEIG